MTPQRHDPMITHLQSENNLLTSPNGHHPAQYSLMEEARRLVAAGVSVIPVDHTTKRPLGDWKQYQERLPEPDELDRWERMNIKAIAIVGGAVSGGVETLDFDVDGYCEAFGREVGDLVKDCPLQRTGGGGYQLTYRCKTPGPNQKLAWHPDPDAHQGRTVAIETRGEGGYFIIPRSVHPSGNHYELLRGDYSNIPTISNAVREVLVQAARNLDQAPHSRQELERMERAKESIEKRNQQQRSATDQPSVIDAYNEKIGITDVLERNGYKPDGRGRYIRPGADRRVGGVYIDGNRSYHHSSNDPLNDGYWKTPFSAFCELEHNGVVKEAVKAAAAALGMKLEKKNEGKRARRKDPTTAEYIEALTDLGYSFTWNECDDTIEVNGERLHTGLSSVIRCAMRDRGFTKVEVMEDAYTAHAYQNRYHPVKRYLEGLQWDGENHIGKLCRYFKDAHPEIAYREGGSASVFGAFLGRWLIGAIAKVYEGAQNPMLVLDGNQDLGKSHFVAWLASPLNEMFLEDAIRPDDKEHNRYLASKWIWEVAELGSTTRRADREALKAFITKQDVTFRKPYERHPIVKPAMASFIGTVNNESGFLSDPTGNRRFLSVTLTGINWKYSAEVDVNQIWAQAYALYRKGESWKLTPEEKKVRDALNSGYEMEDPYEGWILKYYDIDPTQRGDEWFVTTADIVAKLQTMGVTGGTRAIQMSVGATLRRLELAQDPNARPRGWRGIKPKDE